MNMVQVPKWNCHLLKKRNNNMRKIHKYTEEEIQFIKKYAKGHLYKEIQEEFISRFGWDITIPQIKGRLSELNLKTGTRANYYFKKGHIPYNKGKVLKPDAKERLKIYAFKKGNIPSNQQKIGVESVNSKGFVKVKVEEPNKWKLKHKLMYEKYHNVKLTDNDIVLFLDNNKRNFDKENLILINKGILLDINRNLNFHTDDIEIRKAVIALARARYELRMKKQKLKE